MTINLLSKRGRCFTLTSFPRDESGAAPRVQRYQKMVKSGTTLAVVPDKNFTTGTPPLTKTQRENFLFVHNSGTELLFNLSFFVS
jgi:hypothetical protein